MITERERLKLYERLGETLGREEAAFLMELLPPTSWDDIATTRQVQNLGTDLRGEMTELRGELRGEMVELRSDLSSGMDRLQSNLEGRMAMLGGEMAKEMAKNLQIQVGANFAAMVTLVAVIVGLG